jgi:hypothetical protein
MWAARGGGRWGVGLSDHYRRSGDLLAGGCRGHLVLSCVFFYFSFCLPLCVFIVCPWDCLSIVTCYGAGLVPWANRPASKHMEVLRRAHGGLPLAIKYPADPRLLFGRLHLHQITPHIIPALTHAPYWPGLPYKVALAPALTAILGSVRRPSSPFFFRREPSSLSLFRARPASPTSHHQPPNRIARRPPPPQSHLHNAIAKSRPQHPTHTQHVKPTTRRTDPPPPLPTFPR